MNTLAIDIETYSSADLKSSGVYKYTEAKDFAVLLICFSINGNNISCIDMADLVESGPDAGDIQEVNDFVKLLEDPEYLKTAYNAQFERTCLAKFFNIILDPAQWECTMAKAAMLGLPLGLDAVGRALKLDTLKSPAGKALIKYFSMPCKPTKTNDQRTRNLPSHDPDKWQQFIDYCKGDVAIEQEVRKKIAWFGIPEVEKRLWQLDQKINDAGVLLDPPFISNAIKFDLAFASKLGSEATELTGLENPNSVAQLKQWMKDETGEEIESLSKDTIPELLETAESDTVTRVLQIRQEMAKTSVKKYIAMERAICKDNRIRGIHQYYGASRTGRWAGRLVQPQNMPQNHLKDLDLARQLVREGNMEMLEMLFGNVPDTLSQLIRTSFIAPAGSRFIIGDFSAIEARVIAWLAGETWRTEVFKTHGKIYEASGAHMFKVPIEQITKGSPLRQKSKIAELALGFQGGPDALVRMGALKMGLEKKELPKLVKMWRNTNPKIVDYWDTIDKAAIKTVETGQRHPLPHGIDMVVLPGIFFIYLPSGRKLSYLRPMLKTTMMMFFKFNQDYQSYIADQTAALTVKQAYFFESKGLGEITSDQFQKKSMTYEGSNQTTKVWTRQETYGGKLVENIVQAVARDILADAMLRLDTAGYNIVMHVHDEIVIEAAYGKGSTAEVNEIMSQSIPWAKGLPLAAESFESVYYKKD